ncbi:ABC transporter permease [Bradyrhizobium sp. HKCCYLRH3099]|uniref:ABC transporter permease n=1 Tax=unclassified Bradyrhizobium TaxID=2631580 RepID=UPI003EBC56E0
MSRSFLAHRELAPALPLAVIFLGAFVLPLIALLAISCYRSPQFLELSPVQYLRFVTDPFSLRVLADTVMLGLEVALCSLVLAYPLALVYLASGALIRTVLTFLILLPLLTSTVVRTFAWIVILGRDGIVNATMLSLGLWDSPARLLYSWGGLVLALTQIQLPLMALPIINSLLRLDGNLAKAAEGLGAGRFRVFFTVILPLTLPGAVAGGLLVFAAAATAFITQTLVGGGRIILMPSYIYQQSMGVQDWPFAAALSLAFTAAVIGVVAIIGATARRMTRGLDAA